MASTQRPKIASVEQPVTDDSIQVRQVTHHQFSWVAQEPGQPGVWTLQLVMDHGHGRRCSLPAPKMPRCCNTWCAPPTTSSTTSAGEC
jgi:hypothetical protein